MDTVVSADGTRIAVHRTGSGRPVVLVGGAFSTAAAVQETAAAFADAGFEAVTYDRRARGDSGDTRPYDPMREVEDLNAVIDSVGGHAIVLGHSSGAVLTLYAAAHGAAIDHAVLSEPPFHFGEGDPAEDLEERLQAAIDAGRPEIAVTTFQREAVGLPDQLVDQIAHSPLFPALVAVAQSVVYDATLTRACSTPSEEMLTTKVPVTIVRGEATFPFLIQSSDRLASLMPDARLVVVPESRDHRLDGPATARVLREVLA